METLRTCNDNSDHHKAVNGLRIDIAQSKESRTGIKTGDYRLVCGGDILSVEEDCAIATGQQRNVSIVSYYEHQMTIFSAYLHSEK